MPKELLIKGGHVVTVDPDLGDLPAGDVLVTASILRRGRNLIFGDIELHDEAGALAAHATTTVMLLA